MSSKYRKRRRRSRSGSYDSTERKRMREALYMGRDRSRSRSPEWSSTSGSRKRTASPFQSRYEQEMKKKPYEQQAMLIEEMLDSARKVSTEKEMKKHLEPKITLTKKQRKMQARKEQGWMVQDTSWMQDISGMMEKKGGKKGMSRNIPNVMNVNLSEEQMGMADAAAWYAKQRMMGMQQQQQMGQFGGMGGRMGQFGPSGGRSGFVGGPGGAGLYPSLMGSIQGPSFQGGMGRGSMGMGMRGGMGGQGNFGGGPMQGRRQGPKTPAKTPKVPETPIKLELRSGFVTDITLSDPRESSPTAMDSETTPPKITVDKGVDADDLVGARYWKGMPPQITSAKAKPGL